ncbi:MAG: 30S ribosome-binding factor RbfA [Acidimicrobiaceae bacterium]|nr:30S ribosome-binding factor RbfA [Acidimicrobiaceae bacterium]
MTRRAKRFPADHRAGHRTARVGELIRRIVAESMEQLDDERLAMVSVTGVDVDRDLHRAVVWFTSLGDTEEGDADIAEALEEHASHLRRTVGNQTRLRRTPELVFRPDTVLRSAERIERLLDGMDGAADPEN